MGILIQRKFINSASVTVLSKCSTSRFGVSQTLGIFGLNPMSSLLTSWTSRFNQLLANYKSSLLSMFSVYAYRLIGFWNWRKCLRQLRHWHCKIQVPECRTSYQVKLVDHTPLSHQNELDLFGPLVSILYIVWVLERLGDLQIWEQLRTTLKKKWVNVKQVGPTMAYWSMRQNWTFRWCCHRLALAFGSLDCIFQ